MGGSLHGRHEVDDLERVVERVTVMAGDAPSLMDLEAEPSVRKVARCQDDGMNASNGASSTAELEALMATLHSFRAGVLEKLSGLSAEDARRSTVPSGTNVAGLIQHLTFVEGKFFEQIVAGREPSRG